MSTYARITDGVAVEVWTDSGLGIVPADVFVPALAAQFEPVPVEVQAGWSLIDGLWTAPPPAPEPVPEIQSVTMRQARLAMLGAGILDQVETAIAAMEGDEGRAARIDWEYALDVRRDWPLINALGSQLGLTEQQIDELFISAAAVPQ